jgi:hypothetical protein
VLQTTGKKKKKGLLGKLKKLTKSRSIDDGVSDFAAGMSQVIMNCKLCVTAEEMSMTMSPKLCSVESLLVMEI